MLIKKLKLKNIRSYVDDKIIFTEGTTLLSGDIGSGKSSILLAIDFAFFGIRRGELSGSAILRNGANEGYVILDFIVDDKEISIKRTIKKSSNGIVQDSGYLTINEVTQELTPVELKQRVLQLLNYPQEMLTKRSLVYRYTVYTPQEEMKLILLGEKEDRLQTLRKVFNIDKYKRIKDNSKIILNDIKQKKKEYFGIISDLDEKKTKFKEKEFEIRRINEEIERNKIKLEEINYVLNENKEKINIFEMGIIKLNNMKKEMEIISSKINLKEEQKLKNNSNISLLKGKLQEIDSKKITINFEEIKNNIITSEKLLDSFLQELKDITKNIIEMKSKKLNSEEIRKNITQLDFCPLCKQNVLQEHKHGVLEREEKIIKNLEEDLLSFAEKEKQLSSRIEDVKYLINDYKKIDMEYQLHKQKQLDVSYKIELLNNLKNEQEEIESLVKELTIKKEIIEKDLEKIKEIEIDYNKTKKDMGDSLQKQKDIEINLASLKKGYESAEKDLFYIKEEIEKKEKAQARLEYYIRLQDWIENFLINILDVMERKVMLKVHNEFNELFQNWFVMLMDNENIKVRLDEEFTPLIDQNNHDIEYENLSGGEKTACALAYRLALNQVINNIVSSIKTKDIIILDEPTDGFSSEQIEKIKYILQELKMKQIVIVSHESKIETFVDNIIKINKEGHESKILAN